MTAVRYVALTIHGNYVWCGAGAGAFGLTAAVRADGTGLGDDSIFERIEVPGGVVLHPLSGGYLQVRPDDTLAVNPEGYEVWETFQEIEWPGGRFSLKTWRNKFVCAEGVGAVPWSPTGSPPASGRSSSTRFLRPASFLRNLPPEGKHTTIDPRRKLPTDVGKPTHIEEDRRRFP